ncbi:MAG: hypothetical protein F2825_06310, partial [Actinobacteria bacterium]|nr:hypothetical protein [Actinomycetota bacterium]
KATLAPYKYPRDVRFVDALPRNTSGKLQHFKLREQLAGTAPRSADAGRAERIAPGPGPS